MWHLEFSQMKAKVVVVALLRVPNLLILKNYFAASNTLPLH